MPPPACAKPVPYDLVVGLVTVQPSLELARMEQSVELTSVLDCMDVLVCVHPCQLVSGLDLFQIQMRLERTGAVCSPI